MEFKLYDELLSKLNETIDIDINNVCARINNIKNSMSEEDYLKHYEQIYIIIFHHNNLQSKENKSPFDCKIMSGGKGVLVNYVKLPKELQRIIYIYLEIYT